VIEVGADIGLGDIKLEVEAEHARRGFPGDHKMFYHKGALDGPDGVLVLVLVSVFLEAEMLADLIGKVLLDKIFHVDILVVAMNYLFK
jgi:hypothetical protein